jgi:glutathione S-transferase
MTATVYVVPGSHPSLTGMLMLEHKQIRYRRVDLLPAIHKPILRLLGFPATTVPAIRLDGARLQGTLEISQTLERTHPDRPLFPADPRLRAAVETAERWGEEVLQPIPRRLTWWALRRDRRPLRSFADGARLHVPLGLALRTAAPIVLAETLINHASDAAIDADLRALPGLLEQVERRIDERVLDGHELTAADYQIATSIRLLLCFEDLEPLIAGRSTERLARRVAPRFPGRVPAGTVPVHATRADEIAAASLRPA